MFLLIENRQKLRANNHICENTKQSSSVDANDNIIILLQSVKIQFKRCRQYLTEDSPCKLCARCKQDQQFQLIAQLNIKLYMKLVEGSLCNMLIWAHNTLECMGVAAKK